MSVRLSGILMVCVVCLVGCSQFPGSGVRTGTDGADAAWTVDPNSVTREQDLAALSKAVEVLFRREEIDAIEPVLLVVERLDEDTYLRFLLRLCRVNRYSHYNLARRLGAARDEKYIPHLQALAAHDDDRYYSVIPVVGLLPFGYEAYSPYLSKAVADAKTRQEQTGFSGKGNDLMVLLYSGELKWHLATIDVVVDDKSWSRDDRGRLLKELRTLYEGVYDVPVYEPPMHGKYSDAQKAEIGKFRNWLAKEQLNLVFDAPAGRVRRAPGITGE